MKRLLVACVLAGCPAFALAIPTTYDLTFNATAGPSGAGEATFDPTTFLLTGFTWDFGAGLHGGVRDDVLTTLFGGAPVGALLWEVITGENVHPGSSSGVTLFPAQLLAGTTFPTGSARFQSVGAYTFLSGIELASVGTIRVAARTVVSVPEPGILTLLVIGAGALLPFVSRRSLARRP